MEPRNSADRAGPNIISVTDYRRRMYERASAAAQPASGSDIPPLFPVEGAGGGWIDRLRGGVGQFLENSSRGALGVLRNEYLLSMVGSAAVNYALARYLNVDVQSVDMFVRYGLIALGGAVRLVGLPLVEKLTGMESKHPRFTQIARRVASHTATVSLGMNIGAAAGSESFLHYFTSDFNRLSNPQTPGVSPAAPGHADAGGVAGADYGSKHYAGEGLLHHTGPATGSSSADIHGATGSDFDSRHLHIGGHQAASSTTSGPAAASSVDYDSKPDRFHPAASADAHGATGVDSAGRPDRFHPQGGHQAASTSPAVAAAQSADIHGATGSDFDSRHLHAGGLHHTTSAEPAASAALTSSGGGGNAQASSEGKIAIPAAISSTDQVAAPSGNEVVIHGDHVSGSVTEGNLTYNGQRWALAENGLKNIEQHLMSGSGDSNQPAATVDTGKLVEQLDKAAKLWSHGTLDKSSNPDLWKLFNLSNGTSAVYSDLISNNQDTLDSLQRLGVVKVVQ